MSPPCGPSLAYHRRLDRMRRSAPVAELAVIAGQMFALADRLREFSLAHRGGCRCALCVWLRERPASMDGRPDLLDTVQAAAGVVGILSATLDDLRPLTRVEESLLSAAGV